MKVNNNNDIIKDIVSGIAVSLGVTLITSTYQIIKSMKSSIIDIGESDRAYNNINKMLYELQPELYLKHRMPTTNKDYYRLNRSTSYFIHLKKGNYIKIETYETEKTINPESRLKIQFFGNGRYNYREDFMRKTMKLTDEKHIRVQYLTEYNISCDIIPHSFDNIILNETVKTGIIKGLKNWKASSSWYEEHQLVHKIGLFLYGKPGTGKSTIAKAVSAMFDNAPILTIDVDNIMNSINGILTMRKRYDGIIVVLIEDFDMYFKNRETIGVGNIEDENKFNFNQNAVFQLLDGVYSTENTIYIATTNHKERIDPALIRHGRFDIQEELEYFNKEQALQCVELLGYDEETLDSLQVEYPIQPSYLQSKVMEYRAIQMGYHISNTQ